MSECRFCGTFPNQSSPHSCASRQEANQCAWRQESDFWTGISLKKVLEWKRRNKPSDVSAAELHKGAE